MDSEIQLSRTMRRSVSTFCLILALIKLVNAGFQCTSSAQEMRCVGTEGQCYSISQKCDGVVDCLYKTDECQCEDYCKFVLAGHKFCPQDQKCILQGEVCANSTPIAIPQTSHNGVTTHWPKCTTNKPNMCCGGSCYSNDQRCDGTKDCVHGEDETDCDNHKQFSQKEIVLYFIIPSSIAFLMVVLFCLCRRRQQRLRLLKQAALARRQYIQHKKNEITQENRSERQQQKSSRRAQLAHVRNHLNDANNISIGANNEGYNTQEFCEQGESAQGPSADYPSVLEEEAPPPYDDVWNA